MPAEYESSTQRAGRHVFTGVRLLGLPAGPAVLRGRLRRFALLLPWASPLAGLSDMLIARSEPSRIPLLAHLPPPDEISSNDHPLLGLGGISAVAASSLRSWGCLPHRLPFSVLKRQLPGES